LYAAGVVLVGLALGLPRVMQAVEGRLAAGEAEWDAECQALGRACLRLSERLDAAEAAGAATEAARLRGERAEAIAAWRQALRQHIPPEGWGLCQAPAAPAR
jgi:hypothetical protein